MSLTLNMVGGGGKLKNTDAILSVTVPTGSTVTATKGAITLLPTIWTKASDNTLDVALFIIKASLFDDQNSWTVTATLGGDTASDTIVIDAAEEYDMVLSYSLWLYKDGTAYNLVQGRYLTYTQKTVTFGDSSIRLAYIQSDSSNVTCAVIAQTAINLTGYSTLHILIDVTSRPTSAAYNALGLTDASPTYSNFIDRTVLNNTDLLTGEHEYTLDVSSYPNTLYPFWHCNATGANGNLEAYIKRIWLSR